MPAPVPRVAIALPVYNGERYLAQTLDDFRRQTFEDFELVVCDNASTDRTADIALEAAAADSRFRHVRNDRNVGLLANFNRGFEISTAAPYFAWAAHDDRHRPDFLERLVGALDDDPLATLAYGRSAIIDRTGRRLPYDPALRAFIAGDRLYHSDRRLERDIDGPAWTRFQCVLLSTMINTPIHGLFRRSFLETSSLHQFYGADKLLLSEAALAGPFRYVDEPVFEWRLHEGGTAYMTREEWAAVETGIEGFRPAIPIQSFPRYVRAVRRAGMPPADEARAYAAVLRYVVRSDKLQRLFLPRPDNYFGIERWPWQRAPEPRPAPHPTTPPDALTARERSVSEAHV